MLIEVTSSGGFAGLAATQAAKRLNLETIAPTQRAAYCAAFDPEALLSLTAREGASGGADMLTYTIVVTDENNAAHTFKLREDQLPPEILDLIDEM